MNDINRVEIPPVPGAMSAALRFSGYENVSAIEDLIDNSFDAGAKNIWINCDDKNKIFIADDGAGMSYDDLTNALRLGGSKIHDATKDLGRFGLGLITGSTSIAPKFVIITKNDGKMYTAIYDTGVIMDTNEFYAVIRESSELEKLSFDSRTHNAESGTVLILEDCDKLHYDTAADFIKALKKSVRRVFRNFIRDGERKIFINDDENPLTFDDPLFLYDPRVDVRIDKDVDVTLDDGRVEKLHIIAVTLPATEKKEKNPYGVSPATQGFYSLRNGREIAAMQEIRDLFKKHNNYNLLRIELQFTSGLDEEMNVNFSKHDVSPSSKIVNILKAELDDLIFEVAKESVQRQKENREKRAKAKNPFAKANTAPVDKPTEGANEMEKGEQKPASAPEGDGSTDTSVFEGVKIGFRFQKKENPLFDVSVSDESASVLYNGANESYQDKIVNSEYGPEYKKLIDSIMKSLIKTSVENHIDSNKIQAICDGIAKAIEDIKE